MTPKIKMSEKNIKVSERSRGALMTPYFRKCKKRVYNALTI